MRRLKSLSLAVAGLALAAATAAEAGLPTVCTTCGGQPQTSKKSLSLRTASSATRKTAHLCNDCAAKLAAAGPIPTAGPCPSCGEVHTPTVGAPTYASAPGSAPGYAMVGDGSPSPVNMAAGGAPGYAIVGGAIASADPAPIGVMRTNYHEGAGPGTLGASLNSANSAPGTGMPYGGNIPYAKPSELPGGLYSPPNTRHRSHLGRLLLPEFGTRRRAEAEARARQQHAKISYGPASAPTELPASMVFGGGRH